uniref:Uncharacterized protein n=1 Tax=Tetranychus urticae TaxID=32264 RepID=T1KGU9_TETUR
MSTHLFNNLIIFAFQPSQLTYVTVVLEED